MALRNEIAMSPMTMDRPVDGRMKRDGRIYCGNACADDHKSGAGCQHAGCTCHG